jgi:hypothetical protein
VIDTDDLDFIVAYRIENSPMTDAIRQLLTQAGIAWNWWIDQFTQKREIPDRSNGVVKATENCIRDRDTPAGRCSPSGGTLRRPGQRE